jgi:glycosyltransferase involved in cell wall biosynthesis
MKAHRKLRVLHVGGTLGMGGGETWLMELLKHWRATGDVEMDIVLTSGRRGIFDDEAAGLGARLFYLPYTRGNLLRFIRAFRKILKEGRYDALHDHGDYATGWRYLMAAGVLPPVRVTHIHNPWLHITANYAVNPTRKAATLFGEQLVYAFATHVCGTSQAILSEYGFRAGRKRPSVSAVHCGINVGKFNAPRAADRASVLKEFDWPEEAKVVLFAGRLDRSVTFDHPQNHKNSWFALNVVKAALEKDASIRFLMAGDATATGSELEGRIRDWGLSDQLRIIGVRHDIPRLMRAAKALLFPSRQEGLGMVAVEAQAVGLPVLASTAVPAEAVVIPALYRSLPLNAPRDAWADALLEQASLPDAPLDACRDTLEQTPFSIASSARSLVTIYRGR